ncbi:MAG: hypothetical protein ACRDRL_15670 [Sciscionella sp.]
MSNVIDSIPEPYRETFVRVLEERDNTLLDLLRSRAAPTAHQQNEVSRVLALAFMKNVGPDDDHPTEWAVKIDDALGAFLKRWPGEILEDS